MLGILGQAGHQGAHWLLICLEIMKLFFKPADTSEKKQTVELDINPDEFVEHIRSRVSKKGLECHKLIYKGQTLKDDRSFKSYHIPVGATIIIQEAHYGQYLPQGPNAAKRGLEEVEDVEGPAVEPPAKKPAVEKAPAVVEHVNEADIEELGVRVASFGEKGMRRQMEDEHLICSSLRLLNPGLPEERDYAVFAIFDGHGGKAVAGFVKTYVASEIANALAQVPEESWGDKALKKAVESAFKRLDSRIATELPGCYDGSTAVVLLANKETVICANLGDSMAYLCRRTPEGETQSIPLIQRQHKCWVMKEKERILRAGGTVENGRVNGVLEVSRAFGDITLKKYGVLVTPEYMKFKIDRARDVFVILGCDGFWNAWAPQEAVEHTLEQLGEEEQRAKEEGEGTPNLRSVCKALVRHVIEEKKSQDNVSVLICQLGS